MGFSPKRMVRVYIETFGVVKYSLITISAMVALATLTRYAGVDATLGAALLEGGGKLAPGHQFSRQLVVAVGVAAQLAGLVLDVGDDVVRGGHGRFGGVEGDVGGVADTIDVAENCACCKDDGDICVAAVFAAGAVDDDVG